MGKIDVKILSELVKDARMGYLSSARVQCQCLGRIAPEEEACEAPSDKGVHDRGKRCDAGAQCFSIHRPQHRLPEIHLVAYVIEPLIIPL